MKAGQLLHAAVLRTTGEILQSKSGSFLVNTNKAELNDIANDDMLSEFFEVVTYKLMNGHDAPARRTARSRATVKATTRVKNPKRVAAGKAAAAARWGKRGAKRSTKKK